MKQVIKRWCALLKCFSLSLDGRMDVYEIAFSKGVMTQQRSRTTSTWSTRALVCSSQQLMRVWKPQKCHKVSRSPVGEANTFIGDEYASWWKPCARGMRILMTLSRDADAQLAWKEFQACSKWNSRACCVTFSKPQRKADTTGRWENYLHPIGPFWEHIRLWEIFLDYELWWI